MSRIKLPFVCFTLNPGFKPTLLHKDSPQPYQVYLFKESSKPYQLYLFYLRECWTLPIIPLLYKESLKPYQLYLFYKKRVPNQTEYTSSL